jgi:elongation factor G
VKLYKKQTGGRGKFADIIVTMLVPLIVIDDYKVSDLQFVDEVKGGNIPKEFIPSVQKGFEDCDEEWRSWRVSYG